MADELSRLVELGKKIADAKAFDPEKAAKYDKALDEGVKVLEQAKSMLQSALGDNAEEFKGELTKYADVNELILANAQMDLAIEDIDRGPEFEDVLEVLKIVAKVGITVATLT